MGVAIGALEKAVRRLAQQLEQQGLQTEVDAVRLGAGTREYGSSYVQLDVTCVFRDKYGDENDAYVNIQFLASGFGAVQRDEIGGDTWGVMKAEAMEKIRKELQHQGCRSAEFLTSTGRPLSGLSSGRTDVRHIPSSKKLHDVFGPYRDHIGEINMIRYLLVDWKKGDISSNDMMNEANGLLRGYGIEYLRSANGRAEAYYVNMGDTYNATLVLDTRRDRVWATDWGSWVEAEERAGNRFD